MAPSRMSSVVQPRRKTAEADIVIGIDFGMTCTGVAYSCAPNWADPVPLQHWPGRHGRELRSKVPTAISYRQTDGSVAAWGCLVNFADETAYTEELFKLFLDPGFDRGDDPNAIPAEAAQQYFKDYLSCLREYLESWMSQTFPRSKELRVQYLFSTPTTWTSPALVDTIQRLIKDAGYARNSSFAISLTEAEAAAIYAARQPYRRGDVVLVCDAGGGTTDLNVLKFGDNQHDRIQMQQLLWVEGEAVGSALIDFYVERLVTSRLEKVQQHLRQSPEECCETMVRDRFLPFKHAFGTDGLGPQDLELNVPHFSSSASFPDADIFDGKMLLKHNELLSIFDGQVDKMVDLVRTQMERLRQMHPDEIVSFLVLSGGLGSSPYVRRRMEAAFAQTTTAPSSDIQILTAAEPQLAVAFGLVMDRVQNLRDKGLVFEERCARNSYGLLTRELYDPSLTSHCTAELTLDERDGQQWVEGCIHWIGRQGQRISVTDGVKEVYRTKLEVGKEDVPWVIQLVISGLPTSKLPSSINNDGAQNLCTVTALIDRELLKRKNRHWYSQGPQYWRAEFELRVLVGAADLRFELWDVNGTKCYSREHEKIEVDFVTASND